MGLSLPAIVVLLIAIGYVFYLTRKSYEVRVIPGKYKVKIKPMNGVVHCYELYTFKRVLWFIHYYELVGQHISLNEFVSFKFNTADDAVRYYEETFSKIFGN